jgi:phage recombination protein Bet
MGTDIIKVSKMTNETAIVIQTADQSISMSVTDVLRWVAPDAPQHEAFKFLMVCKAAQVNPFLGEAHLVPMGPKWATIIDKSGWFRRVEEHPQYDGMEAGIIVQEIDNSTKPPKKGRVYDVEGTCLPPSHIVVGGWAKTFRKDRSRPSVARVSITEYYRETQTWKVITCTMICKVAKVQSLRESGLAFMAGGYDPAELPSTDRDEDGSYDRPLPADIEVEFSAAVIPNLSLTLAADLKRAINDNQMTDTQVTTMLARRGVNSLVELTDSQAREILAKLGFAYDQAHAGEILLPDTLDATADETTQSTLSPTGDIIDVESFEVSDVPRRP